MKRWGLLVATIAAILSTGFVLHGASRAHASGSGVRKASRDTVSAEVAQRHARCQPHHWRDCLLAR
jgi:hypothetical protein